MEIYEYVHSIGNRMFPTYEIEEDGKEYQVDTCLLYTSPSPRDRG